MARSRAAVVILAAMLLLVGACAEGEGSSTTAADESTDVESATAPASPTSSPSPAATGAASETAGIGEEPTAAQSAPEAPWPAPALPIKRTFVMDQPVFYPSYLDGWLFMGSALGLGRLDVDTGDFDEITTVREDQFHNVTELSRPTEGGVLVMTSTEGIGAREALVMVDPVSFSESGRIDDEPGYLFGWDGDEQVIAIAEQERYDVLDTVTLETEPLPVPGGLAQVPTILGNEIWTIGVDATLVVYDRTSGEELRRTELPLTPGQGRVSISHANGEHIWVGFVGQAVMVKLDRATLEIDEEIDFAQLHGADRASNLTAADSYYLLRVFDEDGEGWTVLGRYDYELGELIHVRAVAPVSPLYGWDTYANAHWVEAEGRLFVQDHRRRIIEVDVGRLAEPSTDVWVDPGLPRDPVLTAEEQEVGDIVLESLNDGIRQRRTRPDAIASDAQAELDRIGAQFSGFARTAWRLDTVGIDGDRAWVWVYPVDENDENPTGALPILQALRRIDGEWFIDSDWTCTQIATLGVECQA